jgi:hypothetical protein
VSKVCFPSQNVSPSHLGILLPLTPPPVGLEEALKELKAKDNILPKLMGAGACCGALCCGVLRCRELAGVTADNATPVPSPRGVTQLSIHPCL